MMFSKESQYISVVRYNNQLKIDYKKLDDGKTAFGKESTFIVRDKVLPKDIATKLNSWQKEVLKTYITTITNSLDEQILTKQEAAKLAKDKYIITSLNNRYDIAISKSYFENNIAFFHYTGIDYVFSPFHILNLYLELNPSKNSLLLFTINNLAYIVITDNISKIIDYKIVQLSTFEEIQKTNFFENDIVGQKLFDEMYYLQLQEAINAAVKDFYTLQNDKFVESVNILYTQKQLNDVQIDALTSEIMIDVNYHNISVKEALFELSKSEKSKDKSFNKPRKKRNKFLRNLMLFFIFIVITLSGSGLYFEHEILEYLQESKEEIKEIKQKKHEKKKKIVTLPNHVIKNKEILIELDTLLETIPIDSVLQKIELKKDNSTLILKLLKEDTYIKAIQPKVLEMYKYSNIQLKENKTKIIDATIYNNEKIKIKRNFKDPLPNYSMDDFKPIARVSDHLKVILPKNAILRYKSSFKSEVTTFNYDVVMLVDSPKEFLQVVNQLNRQGYSIHIIYPLSLEKVSDGIEVGFSLQYHQNQ